MLHVLLLAERACAFNPWATTLLLVSQLWSDHPVWAGVGVLLTLRGSWWGRFLIVQMLDPQPTFWAYWGLVYYCTAPPPKLALPSLPTLPVRWIFTAWDRLAAREREGRSHPDVFWTPLAAGLLLVWGPPWAVAAVAVAAALDTGRQQVGWDRVARLAWLFTLLGHGGPEAWSPQATLLWREMAPLCGLVIWLEVVHWRQRLAMLVQWEVPPPPAEQRLWRTLPLRGAELALWLLLPPAWGWLGGLTCLLRWRRDQSRRPCLRLSRILHHGVGWFGLLMVASPFAPECGPSPVWCLLTAVCLWHGWPLTPFQPAPAPPAPPPCPLRHDRILLMDPEFQVDGVGLGLRLTQVSKRWKGTPVPQGCRLFEPSDGRPAFCQEVYGWFNPVLREVALSEGRVAQVLGDVLSGCCGLFVGRGHTRAHAYGVLGLPQFAPGRYALWLDGRVRLTFESESLGARVVMVTLSLYPWCRPGELEGLLARQDGASRGYAPEDTPRGCPSC